MLNIFIKTIRRSLFLSIPRGQDHFRLIENEPEMAEMVPDDVPEGHFVVVASKGEETKRFVIEIECLNEPSFVKLLEETKEEYGYRQKGVLEVPCRPRELQHILQERRRSMEEPRSSSQVLREKMRRRSLDEHFRGPALIEDQVLQSSDGVPSRVELAKMDASKSSGPGKAPIAPRGKFEACASGSDLGKRKKRHQQ